MKTKTIYKVGELPHLFVHQEVEYAKGGKYEIRNDKFYLNSEIIAQIYGKKLYLRGFSYKSSFGNGISSWDIKQAATNIIEVLNIPIKFNDLRLEYNRQKLVNDFTLYYANELSKTYANLYYMIYGNAKKAYESRIKNNDYVKLLKIFKLKSTKDILDTTIKCSTKIHTGWGKHNYIEYTAPIKTVKWLLRNKFLNKKETIIYKDKIFYSSYIYGSSVPFETSRKLYNTKEKQDAFITEKETRELVIKKHKEETKYQKALNNLQAWIRGGTNITMNSFFEYFKLPVMLRILHDKQVIQTSLGVIFPLEDGHKLYQLYKVCKAKEKLWKTNGKEFNIGNYKLSMIGKRDNKWFILAGCHEVFEDEIERFITYNKLNW